MQTKRPRTTPLVLLFLFTAIGSLPGQQPATGRIVGRVLEAGSTQGIAAVAVHVAGTRHGTVTGYDGRFVIDNV